MIPSTTIRPTNNDASSSTATTTATGSGLATASQTAPADLPRPFDTSLGNNFTSTTCPTFFSSFLNNQTFKNCLPLSLLLQTSNSFFTASRSLVRLSQTLDATCNIDFNTCSTLMASLAQEIQEDAQCGADLEMENPLVTQAYNGFVAYPTLYHAGCLTDNDGKYCFANAVTNASAPSSSYIYYLPLGVQLPGGAKPACNQCLQNTMAIFATTASNSSQPLSKDYTGAAEQVQMTCGPTFVEASVATSAASIPITTSTTLAGALVLLTLIMNLF
ncbi:hypothetical protein M409DRAFT_17475 [Zasmidium cellare ATCC 36951]|uniref:DUF7729 domain-containing protein n=1 Tax=Zasmidium cellare ATCC 36951 TaxID=1080233 RepID=A0A6A6CYE0_ZASCE|nr:uncharacterized protein M409DRAFT_17475 [Zasmidium cellare ATCC 36951]KAF2172237.1 hypothetical protein M409DRAFT_17475 [Zasmidium cellare ATCC 36951]